MFTIETKEIELFQIENSSIVLSELFEYLYELSANKAELPPLGYRIDAWLWKRGAIVTKENMGQTRVAGPKIYELRTEINQKGENR